MGETSRGAEAFQRTWDRAMGAAQQIDRVPEIEGPGRGTPAAPQAQQWTERQTLGRHKTAQCGHERPAAAEDPANDQRMIYRLGFSYRVLPDLILSARSGLSQRFVAEPDESGLPLSATLFRYSDFSRSANDLGTLLTTALLTPNETTPQ